MRFADGTLAADDAFRSDPFAEGRQLKPFKPLLPASHVV